MNKHTKIVLLLFVIGFIFLIVNSSNVSASVCKNYERAVEYGRIITGMPDEALPPEAVGLTDCSLNPAACRLFVYNAYFYKPGGKINFDQPTPSTNWPSTIDNNFIENNVLCGHYSIKYSPFLQKVIEFKNISESCLKSNEAIGKTRLTNDLENQFIDSIRGELDFVKFWNILPAFLKDPNKGICDGGSNVGHECTQATESSVCGSGHVCIKWKWQTSCVQKDKCMDNADNDGEEDVSQVLPYKSYLPLTKLAIKDGRGIEKEVTVISNFNVGLVDQDDPQCKFKPGIDWFPPFNIVPQSNGDAQVIKIPYHQLHDYQTIPYSLDSSGNKIPYCMDNDGDGFCGCIQNANGEINTMYWNGITTAGINNIWPGSAQSIKLNKGDRVKLCLDDIDGNSPTWSATITFNFVYTSNTGTTSDESFNKQAVMQQHNGERQVSCSLPFIASQSGTLFIPSIITSTNTVQGDRIFVGTGSGTNDGSACNWIDNQKFYHNQNNANSYTSQTQFPDCDDNLADDAQQYLQYTATIPRRIKADMAIGWLTKYSSAEDISAWNVHPLAPITTTSCTNRYYDFNCNKDFVDGWNFLVLQERKTPFDFDLRTGVEVDRAQGLYDKKADLLCYYKNEFEDPLTLAGTTAITWAAGGVLVYFVPVAGIPILVMMGGHGAYGLGQDAVDLYNNVQTLRDEGKTVDAESIKLVQISLSAWGHASEVFLAGVGIYGGAKGVISQNKARLELEEFQTLKERFDKYEKYADEYLKGYNRRSAEAEQQAALDKIANAGYQNTLQEYINYVEQGLLEGNVNYPVEGTRNPIRNGVVEVSVKTTTPLKGPEPLETFDDLLGGTTFVENNLIPSTEGNLHRLRYVPKSAVKGVFESDGLGGIKPVRVISIGFRNIDETGIIKIISQYAYENDLPFDVLHGYGEVYRHGTASLDPGRTTKIDGVSYGQVMRILIGPNKNSIKIVKDLEGLLVGSGYSDPTATSASPFGKMLGSWAPDGTLTISGRLSASLMHFPMDTYVAPGTVIYDPTQGPSFVEYASMGLASKEKMIVPGYGGDGKLVDIWRINTARGQIPGNPRGVTLERDWVQAANEQEQYMGYRLYEEPWHVNLIGPDARLIGADIRILRALFRLSELTTDGQWDYAYDLFKQRESSLSVLWGSAEPISQNIPSGEYFAKIKPLVEVKRLTGVITDEQAEIILRSFDFTLKQAKTPGTDADFNVKLWVKEIEELIKTVNEPSPVPGGAPPLTDIIYNLKAGLRKPPYDIKFKSNIDPPDEGDVVGIDF